MNKLHPQELADLLNKIVAMDHDYCFYIYNERVSPNYKLNRWGNYEDCMEVTHAIAKPDDCPEWDKAIWEPRVMPERGQLCLFADEEEELTIEKSSIGYFDSTRVSENGYIFVDDFEIGWRYCKPVDSVPTRIDLDAQRSE